LSGHVDSVIAILAAPALTDAKQVLFYAIDSGSLPILRSMLTIAPPQACSLCIGEATPVMRTVLSGRLDMCQELVKSGADLSISNAQGETALSLALKWSPSPGPFTVEFVEFLIEKWCPGKLKSATSRFIFNG
jgi:hypothetical protein